MPAWTVKLEMRWPQPSKKAQEGVVLVRAHRGPGPAAQVDVGGEAVEGVRPGLPAVDRLGKGQKARPVADVHHLPEALRPVRQIIQAEAGAAPFILKAPYALQVPALQVLGPEGGGRVREGPVRPVGPIGPAVPQPEAGVGRALLQADKAEALLPPGHPALGRAAAQRAAVFPAEAAGRHVCEGDHSVAVLYES